MRPTWSGNLGKLFSCPKISTKLLPRASEWKSFSNRKPME